MHLLYFEIYTTGATSRARTTPPSGTPEFIPVFIGVRVTRSLVFCVVFCRSLFVLFLCPLCCLSFCLFPVWCLQTLHTKEVFNVQQAWQPPNTFGSHYGPRPGFFRFLTRVITLYPSPVYALRSSVGGIFENLQQ